MAIAILDIDGTLVDTNYHHALAWSRALARFDLVLPISPSIVTLARVDDFGRLEQTKPAPDLVHSALERVGANGDRTAVMVGDPPGTWRRRTKAGVETLAVLTGGFSEQELREAGTIAVFESVAELEDRLAETPLARS